ncbi:MAG TPA: HAD-IA family hydrolase [Candidatus Anaerobiospirillum stercoravium]|nr:HAD-IA family hydrolase [Candidatus Anaerobiospirillum stercoravium]
MAQPSNGLAGNGLAGLDLTRYRALVFDLDGTLIDSMPYHVRAWQQVAQEHDGFVLEPDFIYQRGGFSSPNIVRDLIAAGCKVPSVEAFVQRKVELYRAHMAEVPVFDQVLQILKEARARGAKIGIGTGTQRINAVDILKQHHLSEFIDVIVSGDDVQKHKPEPDTFLKALEQVNVAPKDALIVEDGLPGIQAAANGHLDCLVVDRGNLVRFIPAH